MENKKFKINVLLPGGKNEVIEKEEHELTVEEINFFTGNLIHMFNNSPEKSKTALINKIILAIDDKPQMQYINPIDDIETLQKIADEEMKSIGGAKIEKLSIEQIKDKYGDYLGK